MLRPEDTAALPEPLSARFKDTFAYPTMKERQPVILTKVIDYLFRERNSIAKIYGEDVLEDLKAINELLAQLRYELMTDKPIRPLEDTAMHDIQLWNMSIEDSIKEHAEKNELSSWFTAPWLLTECYMYRRIKEAFNRGSATKKLVNFDFFAELKENELKASMHAVRLMGKFLLEKLEHLSPENAASSKTLFVHLTELCLWGNKCDLCISRGSSTAQKSDPLEDLDTFRPNLLSDHIDDVWSFFVSSLNIGPAEIGFICDNAAFELFSDFALADFLVTSGIASRVVFHVKQFPWFVSDTTEPDVEHLLKTLEGEQDLSPLAVRWRGFLVHGSWKLETDLYWTLGVPFWKMKKLRPSLYRRLGESRLLMIKGDLNYRKLLGDLNWEHHTSFDLALMDFHPAALVALRTMKSDIVAGLRPYVGKNAHTVDPDWMVTGKYGLVQFCGRKDTDVL